MQNAQSAHHAHGQGNLRLNAPIRISIGRSDYLPCITWGLRAKDAADWTTGTVVSLDGRIQSRRYIKNIDGIPEEKTAYEVSVIEIEVLSSPCKL